MKQGDEMDRFDEQVILRQYLLGMLADRSVHSHIEERLIVDDEYAAQISAAEDQLIEEFLDGELTAEESDAFKRFFLAPPERMRQLRLTRGLRRLSAEYASDVPHRQKRSLTGRSLSWGWLRFAFVAAVLLITIFAVWRFAIYRSDTDRGIEQLQAAFRDRRPVESRVAEFGSYAPYSETRGGDSAASNQAALDRANRYLLDAAADPNNASAHRASAVYYMAAHDLDRAIRESEIALNAAPNDSRVQSDAGAVYYEAAKDTDDSAKKLALLDKSLRHLERAIALDPKLLEPRFDRALCLEALINSEQAKDAWNEYITLDPNSRWSDEAKRHLQRLEQNAAADRSADELESDFLQAVRVGDRAAAERLIGESREAIREKYLPQRLAMSYTTADPDRRTEFLQALRYSGEIESALRGDSYANDVAHFYASMDDNTLAVVRDAQQAVRDGYAKCTANDYAACLSSFESARDRFEKAGDEPEAQLAGYFVAYGQLNDERHAEALATINGVADYARSRGYRWMEMTATYWVGGCLFALKKTTPAIDAHQRALSLAQKTNDSYAIDRNLNALAEIESYSRQDSKALTYTLDALRLSSGSSASLRQRYRDLAAALPILSRARLYYDAKFAALESIAVADLQKDPVWMAQSRGYAGVAFQEAGDLSRAREFLEQSRSFAESIENEQTRQKVIAFAKLRSGDVEYAAGDFAAADRFYSDAAAIYDGGVEIPLNREEAHLGVLRCDLALGNVDELEQQIPINIRLTEESRYGILDEAQRTGFFDSRVNVYDIASEFELSRGNAPAAYNYAEMSSSRSLLDHMLTGLDPANGAEGKSLLLNGNATPLDLNELRAQIPPDAQIVQYSVFSDKLIIWILTTDDFAYFSVPISEKDLKEKVISYAQLVSKPDSDSTHEQAAARELYELLIAPVRSRLNPGRQLYIVPSRALFEVPFAALLTPEGERLVKQFSLLYSPSANVFISATTLAAQKHGSSADETLLAVGDPAFDRTRHPQLPTLADASIEAKEIAQLYGPQSRLLVGENATKPAFSSSVDDSDVVHFAGHYVAEPASPMSSYLLFAQHDTEAGSSELTGLELAGMSLKRTRLVVLAACDSGAETWYEGEGMIGAARSLLAAGVPLVVASQWAVDSNATSALMTRFHEVRRQQHRSTAGALREAQIAMIDGQLDGYTSPYYWAGFGVFGGAANF